MKQGVLANVETLVAFLLLLFLSPRYSYPQSKDDNVLMHIIVDTKTQTVKTGLDRWTDPDMIKKLSKISLSDNYVKRLYQEFKKAIIVPSAVNNRYSLGNIKDALSEVEQLGRKIHNLRFTMSSEEKLRYGDFLDIMRDVLYIDSRYLSSLMKKDNTSDVYFYTPYSGWVEYVDKEYKELFGKK